MKELASILDRDPSTVGKIEAGRAPISAAGLVTLHQELGLSLDWLMAQAYPEPDFVDDRHEGSGPEVYFSTRIPRDAGRPFDCHVYPRTDDDPPHSPVAHAGAEFIQLISGEALVTVGDREVHLWRKSSVLRIPPWVEHAVRPAKEQRAEIRWTMSEEGEEIHTASFRPQSEWIRQVLARRAGRRAAK